MHGYRCTSPKPWPGCCFGSFDSTPNPFTSAARYRQRDPMKPGAPEPHASAERLLAVKEAAELPAIEAIDALAPEALPSFLAHLAALQGAVAARLALVGSSGTRSTADAARDEDTMTPEEVGAFLKAKVAWVYRHRAQLGGEKLDGLVRFSRRRVLAYVERQRRLSA
jgi:hypothetical protein